MPSTLTPGRPPAIGRDGQDTPIPLETPGQAARPEPPGLPGLPASSGLRLIAVPAGWPPYDCETHGAACPAAGGAAAGVPAAGMSAAGGTAAANARADAVGHADASQPSAGRPGAGQPSAGQVGTGRAEADQAEADQAEADQTEADQTEADQTAAWPRQFAQVLVEILAGARPSRQVIPWTTEPVRAQIDHLSHELGPGRRPRIQRVVTSRPTARVVEMTVVVSFGTRSKALAMRLEHVPARHPGAGRPARPARWLCTDIEAG